MYANTVDHKLLKNMYVVLKSKKAHIQTQFHALLSRHNNDFAWGEFSAGISNALSAYMTFLCNVYMVFKVKAI